MESSAYAEREQYAEPIPKCSVCRRHTALYRCAACGAAYCMFCGELGYDPNTHSQHLACGACGGATPLYRALLRAIHCSCGRRAAFICPRVRSCLSGLCSECGNLKDAPSCPYRCSRGILCWRCAVRVKGISPRTYRRRILYIKCPHCGTPFA